MEYLLKKFRIYINSRQSKISKHKNNKTVAFNHFKMSQKIFPKMKSEKSYINF